MIHVLYLEDDEALGDVTASMLERANFTVTWAKNGNEGLNAFLLNKYDVCIIDIMMPGLDGYSLIQSIRKNNSTVPIIILSARILTEDVVKGFDIGADDYMRKPFSVDELIARIKKRIQNNNTVNIPTTIKVGKYIYNPATMELKFDDSAVILSPRAAQILFRLLTNESNILLKRDILIELWGDDNFFTGRSLDVFITKLRKQFLKDENIRIVNIRGKGYQLIY